MPTIGGALRLGVSVAPVCGLQVDVRLQVFHGPTVGRVPSPFALTGPPFATISVSV